MIPNIFVSSTIADLHYLRDGLREAIEELAYRPVMSEFGEIGYLAPKSAAEACYTTASQCQMMVLIIGARYGTVGEDGLSVTHREYRAAREANLPCISFVEPRVLAHREVFEVSRDAPHWTNFAGMDNPKGTFDFIGEVRNAATYNAVLPFINVQDAKRQLKAQIANFVGDRFAEAVSPSAQFIKEVLAEVKTIRSQLARSDEFRADTDRARTFFAVARFLLNDAAQPYREFLLAIFNTLDEAIEVLPNCVSVDEVVARAGRELRVVARDQVRFHDGSLIKGHFSDEAWGIERTGAVLLSEGQYRHFDALQSRLRAELPRPVAAATESVEAAVS